MEPAAGTPPATTAIAFALLAGIGGCLALPALPPWPWLAAAFAAGLALALRAGGGWRLAGVLALGFGLAGLHAAATLARQLPQPQLDAGVSGRVVGLPEHGPERTRFLLRADAGPTVPPQLRGRLLRLSWYDERGWRRDRGEAGVGRAGERPRHQVEAGSRWSLQVRVRPPRGLRNPGGFDVEKHALAARISATGYVRDAGRAELQAGAAGIDAWRARVAARIQAAVASDSQRFVRALAVGDTRGLEQRDWEVLRANGLTHLVAISGFHVGMVAGFVALFAHGLWWLLPGLGRRLPRPQAAAAAALLGGLGYAAVAGFELPTVRTVLMIAVVAGARLSRRPIDGFDALALAAIAICLVDPLSLLSAGFWLSFAGVAWLLWCLPHGHQHPLRGLLGAQGVASIGLLPLTVVLFDQASLAGPFANLLAVPWWSLVVVPLALLGTLLDAVHAGAAAWTWRLAAAAFDLPWPWFERLHETGLALWWLPESPWFALPLALFGAFWLLLPRGTPGKPLALLLWLPLLWPARVLPAPGGFELQVLDVGQGSAVLLRTHRHVLLYDMGPAIGDAYDAGERVVVPALHALGVRRLDMAVASHGDADHAGGWGAVLRALPVADSLAPEGEGVEVARACIAGEAWEWDGVRLRMLHPTPHFPIPGNEASCVLRIEGAHGAALLTGDIGHGVERILARRDRDALQAEVVMVGHHGSRGSSDPVFVAATGAHHALVSAGAGGRFRHPHPEVVARWSDAGAQVHNTADAGALRVRVGAEGIEVSGRRASHRRLWDAVRRQRCGAGLSCAPD
jgi:competence protein ComEC